MRGGEILLPRTPLFSLKTERDYEKGALPRTVPVLPAKGAFLKKAPFGNPKNFSFVY